MPQIKKPSSKLDPYEFHGVDFSYREGDDNATAECPFCGREDKFSVLIENGQWRCFGCEESGNDVTFLRKLWAIGDKQTSIEDSRRLAEERGLAFPETPMLWGAAKSPMIDEWILPGHNPEGKICQLYSWRIPWEKDKPILQATKGLNHQLFYALGTNLKKPSVIFICEGPWDGMALWEILQRAKETDEGLKQTANRKASLANDAAVVALPGVGAVGKPFQKFLPLFVGKTVNLMFDSDHPRKHPQADTLLEPSGLGGMRRAAEILSQSPNPPEQINYQLWSADGYDPDQPSGFDLRDDFNL